MSVSRKKATKSTAKATGKATAKAPAKATGKAAAKGRAKGRAKTPTNPDSMSEEVIEFITAVDDYKRKNQRPFPSWSEILEVVKNLGYERQD